MTQDARKDDDFNKFIIELKELMKKHKVKINFDSAYEVVDFMYKDKYLEIDNVALNNLLSYK